MGQNRDFIFYVGGKRKEFRMTEVSELGDGLLMPTLLQNSRLKQISSCPLKEVQKEMV